MQAVESNGKAGVVWHTQGSGKSMEMELYANLVARQPKLLNPTVVVDHRPQRARRPALRDFNRACCSPRNPCRSRPGPSCVTSSPTAPPVGSTSPRCRSSASTEEEQAGAEHPLLSDRRNIIVIVDEAHRSHYDDLDGYARHLKRRPAERRR